jgi:hypothetical protein
LPAPIRQEAGSRAGPDSALCAFDLLELEGLRAIAERGYGGAASPDQDQRAQAISLFITDMLARSAS